jgi:hypothetical protein
MITFRQIADDLLSTVNHAQSLLEAIPESKASAKPQPNKWSPKEVIGHLIDSASNNHQRFVRAASKRELTFPGYEQDVLVTLVRPNDANWELLVRLWESYNRYLAHVIAHLPESAAEVSCMIGENRPATLRFLAEDYVAHLKHHLNQILGQRFKTAYGAKG